MFEPLEAASADGLSGDLLPSDFSTGLQMEDDEKESLEWFLNLDLSGLDSLEIPGSEGGGTAALAATLEAAWPKTAVRARSKGERRPRRKWVLPVLWPVENKRRCRHCKADETPQWRTGPEGPKTLCNACGVRYSSGRLFPEYRPANSPTFSTKVHSNSHRKIMEMRRSRDGGRKKLHM